MKTAKKNSSAPVAAAAAAPRGRPIRPGAVCRDEAVENGDDGGVYRCAKCGGAFAVALVPVRYADPCKGFAHRLSTPVLPDGARAPVRPKVVIGGRPWCEKCAAARFRRRTEHLGEWAAGLQGNDAVPVPTGFTKA